MNVSSARFKRRPRQYWITQFRFSLRRPNGRATRDPSRNSFSTSQGDITLMPRFSFTNSLMASMLPSSITVFSTTSSLRK